VEVFARSFGVQAIRRAKIGGCKTQEELEGEADFEEQRESVNLMMGC